MSLAAVTKLTEMISKPKIVSEFCTKHATFPRQSNKFRPCLGHVHIQNANPNKCCIRESNTCDVTEGTNDWLDVWKQQEFCFECVSMMCNAWCSRGYRPSHNLRKCCCRIPEWTTPWSEQRCTLEYILEATKKKQQEKVNRNALLSFFFNHTDTHFAMPHTHKAPIFPSLALS